MTESEVRKIFMLIDNAFMGFHYDDFKVEYWRELLEDVPYELARRNLDEYILNPDNRFPPTAGQLARRPAEHAEGRYVPGVEETRRALDEKEAANRSETAVPMPPELKERLRLIAGN